MLRVINGRVVYGDEPTTSIKELLAKASTPPAPEAQIWQTAPVAEWWEIWPVMERQVMADHPPTRQVIEDFLRNLPAEVFRECFVVKQCRIAAMDHNEPPAYLLPGNGPVIVFRPAQTDKGTAWKLAHEGAHLWASHSGTTEEEILWQEDQANAFAAQWGFFP